MARIRSVAVEPEPIEAEFEPAALETAESAPHRRRSRTPIPRLSRFASRAELAVACLLSSVAGAAMSAIYTGANSGAATGTLAREIDGLHSDARELSQMAARTSADLTALRSRLDGQSDRIDERARHDKGVESELAALTAQLSALAGADEGGRPAGTRAAASPLGALLARLDRLETLVGKDEDLRTPLQMQRTVRLIAERLDHLEGASQQLAATLDQRRLALAGVESRLFDLEGDVDGLSKVGASEPRMRAMGGPDHALPASEAASSSGYASRTDQAMLALLMELARTGQPFAAPFDDLARILPADADLMALGRIAHTGAPTLPQLKASLAQATPDTLAAARQSADDGWDWLRTAASGVTRQRRADTEATASRLLRLADTRLASGDLDGALTAIDSIGGTAGRTLLAWRAGAERRRDLDARLKSLTRRLSLDASPPV